MVSMKLKVVGCYHTVRDSFNVAANSNDNGNSNKW